jgi:hypothetical protein
MVASDNPMIAITSWKKRFFFAFLRKLFVPSKVSLDEKEMIETLKREVSFSLSRTTSNAARINRMSWDFTSSFLLSYGLTQGRKAT